MGSRPVSRWKDAGFALACAAAVCACWLASDPRAEFPFNDDFSYTFTARRLAQTGQFTYNGWAAMAIGPMAYWGALFIKLFGFSFTLMRVAMLPIAAGSAAISYALARRCGLRPGLAALSSLTLCASPLFLPLAASFMTDVPGLFFMLAALYAMIAAGRAPSARRAGTWTMALVALALVGGTVRQIVWITAIAGLPCIAWAWRKNRLLVLIALVGWIGVAGGAVATEHWFARQPYAIPDEPLASALRRIPARAVIVTANLAALALKLAMLTLPISLCAVAGGWRRVKVGAWVAVVGVVAVVTVAWWRNPGLPGAPWIGNTVTIYGVMDWGGWGQGRPEVLPAPVWFALSLLSYAMGALGLVLALAMVRPVLSSSTCWRGLATLTPRQWSIAALLVYALGYVVLTLPRCAANQAYDRYLLPLFPVVTVPLLLLYQGWEAQRAADERARLPGALAWMALVALAFFGIAITQDLQALGRARAALADELIAAGIPRRQIDAGFEFNFWTQLEEQGYINDVRLSNPPGAYQPGRGIVPVWDPRYRIVFADAPLARNEAITSFAAVDYGRLLPPFHRQLTVRRIIGPLPRLDQNAQWPWELKLVR